MASKSAIEWTDVTWNPVTGCTKISPGCDNCYAERIAERFRGIPGHHFEQGFDLRLFPKRLEKPLSWKKPRKIFVNSMSDLMHEDIPPEFVRSIIKVMMEAAWHTFQVLTKRPIRMMDFPWYPNIWGGTSVESKKYKFRIDVLKRIDLNIRFLSLEPLLEDLGELDLTGISWVIVGGESGPGARPMDAAWVRNIRDQCIDSKVAFFFKQWGGVRKKETGRELDGKYWDQFPEENND